MTDTVIDRVRQSRDANRQEREGLRADMDAIITRSAANPGQTLNAQDSRRFSRLEARGREMASEARQLDDRLDELVDSQRRLDRTAAATAGTGDLAETRGPRSPMYTSSETYHKGTNSPSFFRDLIFAQRGDANAADRLRTNNAEVGLEARALGNTSSTGGSGGEFAPPGWLINDWVQLARPGRVTADLFHHEALPPGVSSVNLPRVGSGTAVTVQSTQNTTLANVDLTSAALSSGVVTIGGRQIVSQQLLDQSPVQFDRIVLEDLAQDYARALGVQVLTGSGTAGQLKGYLTPASTNVVTWTQATPTASGFYSQLAKLQGQIRRRHHAPASLGLVRQLHRQHRPSAGRPVRGRVQQPGQPRPGGSFRHGRLGARHELLHRREHPDQPRGGRQPGRGDHAASGRPVVVGVDLAGRGPHSALRRLARRPV